MTTHREGFRCSKCCGRKLRCAACRDEKAAYRRELHARKLAIGQCTRCNRDAEPGMRMCAGCRDRNNAYSRASHARLRQQRKQEEKQT